MGWQRDEARLLRDIAELDRAVRRARARGANREDIAALERDLAQTEADYRNLDRTGEP